MFKSKPKSDQTPDRPPRPVASAVATPVITQAASAATVGEVEEEKKSLHPVLLREHFSVSNPAYEGANVSPPVLTKTDNDRSLGTLKSMILELKDQVENNKVVTKEHSLAMIEVSLAIVENVEQSRLVMSSRVDNDDAFSDASSGTSPEDYGHLFVVVLTIGTEANVGSIEPSYVRGRIMNWVDGFIKRNSIDVYDGPWLDDNRDFTQPHVNMTCRADSREALWDKLRHWAHNKGYVHCTPVVAIQGWISYSQRNHDVCVAVRDGTMTQLEGKGKIAGRMVPVNNYRRTARLNSQSTRTIVYEDD